MRRFFVGFFAVVGIIAFVGFLGLVALTVSLVKYAGKAAPLPQSIVLTADLTGGLADKPDPDPMARLLFDEKGTLRDFVDAVDRAADDPRVKGLYLELGDDSLGLAKTQQVRDTIAHFRAKGKYAVAFADTFGEGDPGTRPYYLATACDEIWLQPLGEVSLTGLRSETPFLKGLLDKLGIAADFDHREEFKTAMNSLTETQMTAPQREEVEGLLTSIWGQIAGDIAKARNLSPERITALADRAPLLADEAQPLGLVDKLGYRDQALAEARAHGGDSARLMNFSKYFKAAGRPHASGSRIALIYGTGLITRGGSAAGVFADEDQFTARSIGRAFAAATRDKDVRAIVFRIDSPGGSATASETIWRNVAEARRAGKPVIVSMGDVAASGGYYVAAPADKIVAEPATLTGSIGVLAGKLVLGGLMQKLGVTTDSAERGANSGMFSAASDFTPAQRERLDAELDNTYAGFKNHVVAGRHLTTDQVEAAAKGRVWSGEDAKGKGLVDALGGYETAFDLAREAAKLPEDAPIDVVVYPRERGLSATLIARLRGDDIDETSALGGLGRGLTMLRMIIAAVDLAIEDPGILRMAPVGDIR
ncbi:MAG TPA: signal peptide peptidase SppA [Stellaceae bacterium]|nr:signal peptide peptidase SppA [Stellaceae bacterium]